MPINILTNYRLLAAQQEPYRKCLFKLLLFFFILFFFLFSFSFFLLLLTSEARMTTGVLKQDPNT